MGFGGVKLNAKEIKGNRLGNKNSPSPKFATVLSRAPYILHVNITLRATHIWATNWSHSFTIKFPPSGK